MKCLRYKKSTFRIFYAKRLTRVHFLRNKKIRFSNFYAKRLKKVHSKKDLGNKKVHS